MKRAEMLVRRNPDGPVHREFRSPKRGNGNGVSVHHAQIDTMPATSASTRTPKAMKNFRFDSRMTTPAAGRTSVRGMALASVSNLHRFVHGFFLVPHRLRLARLPGVEHRGDFSGGHAAFDHLLFE